MTIARLLVSVIAFTAMAALGQPPVRIVLVGDSTVAVNNGWGPGFCALATARVTCVNLAKNGRSTSSYRAEGSWAEVLDTLKKGEVESTYVLIQFGHNDQPGKPGRSTDLATEFPANLRRYVNEAQAAGAKPVLITSLTRRTFRHGELQDTLLPWAEAAKKVASEAGVPVLDLNARSAAAVAKMGPVEANKLAMVPPPPAVAEAALHGESVPVPKDETAAPGDPVFDYTHLGPAGSAFFGRMVATELVKAVPTLGQYFNP